MLQIDVMPFASDALEDAMRLAQTKALNSYTFSDCFNYLNYAWSDIYNQLAGIDDGYYGVNIRITQKLTHLPKCVKSSIMIYSAQSPTDHIRDIYRPAGNGDIMSSNVYKISGNDLYVPDASRRVVWLYYVPACSQLFFTHHNRDPIIHNENANNILERSTNYNMYSLKGYINDEQIDIPTATREQLGNITKWALEHKIEHDAFEDITEYLLHIKNEDVYWKIVYISCDFPYIFVTFENSVSGEHLSGFFTKDMQFTRYNPFEFTGRSSNVEYLKCHWNDKTGMGVIVQDYNDNNTVKELGWTPDTRLDYPAPEMYRYLVARLADKLSAFNETNVMGVQKELIEAKYAFEQFISKDKSGWARIRNVNLPKINDWI